MYRCLETKLKICLNVQWTLFFETPLFKGNLHSGITKFGLGKMFTQSLHLLPLLKGHLYSEERDTFSRSRNPDLTFIQGTP